jgi:hypothetical protein
MTPTSMPDALFMREGFRDLRLEPETHSQFLFGDRDRKIRDELLEGIEEGHLGGEGHKAVRYGDYGRGKTQQSQNLIYEIDHRELPVKPVYVKCTEYKKNEPFSTLFTQMITSLGTQEVNALATEFQRRVSAQEVQPLEDIIASEEILEVFKRLSHPTLEYVRYAMKWLGGDSSLTKPERNQLMTGLGNPVSVSRDFSEVMRGFAHMYQSVEDRMLIFFIDEAERLNLITHPDTFWSWTACWRELTDIVAVGFIFLVGAKTRDDLPLLLINDEILTRIGSTNYKDILNPGRDELKAWVLEFLQTLFRKGDVPAPLQNAVAVTVGQETVDDTEIPEELWQLVGEDQEALIAYPFTPEALEAFITQCLTEEYANKPREVLKRMRKAAAKAVMQGKRQIDEDIVEEIQGGGF